MIILADAQIPALAEHFAALGELRRFDGRHLDRAVLADAEVLLVRSVTPVTAELVSGSRLRFVGSATAGIDHVDTGALAAAGIAFSDAAGCNARAVTEHVVTLLFLHAARRQCRVRDLAVGIIGCGHVGRSLGRLLDALGVVHVDHDPPRAAREPGWVSAPLADALACEVVSLHVPLVTDGPWSTRDLLGREAIATLAPGTLVINAARGGVLDEAALLGRLAGPGALLAAIDCWAEEPRVNPALLARTWFATPHLAGHTYEARLAATRLLWQTWRRWRGLPPAAPPLVLPDVVGARELPPVGGIAALLATLHPLAAHDVRMRASLALPGNARGGHFDEIRRRYALRREFPAYAVARAGLDPDTVDQLAALGFGLAVDRPTPRSRPTP